MVDFLGLPIKQAGWQASNFAGEGELGAWHQAYCHAEVVDIGEAARSGTKITCHKFITHFRGPRLYALEAKVTHRRLHVLPA